jgi:hypothetical protein
MLPSRRRLGDGLTCGLLRLEGPREQHRTEPNDAMTAASAYPWRRLPTIFPNVPVSANGITRSRAISSRFVNGFGFSNGWAEFAL